MFVQPIRPPKLPKIVAKLEKWKVARRSKQELEKAIVDSSERHKKSQKSATDRVMRVPVGDALEKTSRSDFLN